MSQSYLLFLDDSPADQHIVLDQAHSHEDLYFLVICGSTKNNLTISVRHAADGIVSRTHIVALCPDGSQGRIVGNLIVPRNISNSDGYLMEETVLLGSTCAVQLMPNLDVTGSSNEAEHGASVEALTHKHPLYLASRGLDEEAVRNLFVESYIARVEIVSDPEGSGRRSTPEGENVSNEERERVMELVG